MISSRQNQFVKAIRKLRHSKGDTALLEGSNLVDEAARSGIRPQWVLTTPEFAATATGRQLLGRFDPGTVHRVSTAVLDSVADADSPQGILACAELPRRGFNSLPVISGSCLLFLDRVQDPGNLGAIARVAEATGVVGLALSPGAAHPNHPRALRASAGSLLRLPVAIDCELADLRQHLGPIEPSFVALDLVGEDLYSADLSGTVVLLLGNEGAGLGSRVLAGADRRLAIPMSAPLESLNVAVAAAVTLFERRRRLRSV